MKTNKPILADGAMGTYLALRSGRESVPEIYNLKDPGTVKSIHEEYINAGSRIIRTNTFTANTFYHNCGWDHIREIITRGYKIAINAAENKDVRVLADIGPISADVPDNEAFEEYMKIIDLFLDLGAKNFIFETFSSTKHLDRLSEYIKQSGADTVIASFALTPDGITRAGIPATEIIKWVKEHRNVDIIGFNCGCGPAHLRSIISNIDTSGVKLSLMPNAGYAKYIENNRFEFSNHAGYFAQTLLESVNINTVVIGGCCGTTPEHIYEINKRLQTHAFPSQESSYEKVTFINKNLTGSNSLRDKLDSGKFVVTVELEPPKDNNAFGIINAAGELRSAGADAVTIPDSPLARMRMDSLALSPIVKREADMETIPHLTCRDKNSIALRAGVLASHFAGIRNILAITGDAVNGDSKPVFDLNSYGLIELLNTMNKSVFQEEEINICCALNINAPNLNKELERALIKISKGAQLIFTQPLHTQNAINALPKVKSKLKTKIIAGLLPIVSRKNALFLAHEFPGISVPEEIIERFSQDMTKEECECVSIDITTEIAKKIRENCDGFYLITPFNRTKLIIRIIERFKKEGLL